MTLDRALELAEAALHQQRIVGMATPGSEHDQALVKISRLRDYTKDGTAVNGTLELLLR